MTADAMSQNIRPRAFFFDSNKGIVRISMKRFGHLGAPGSDEAFPEYANQRIRYALVFLRMENRNPIGIEHAEFGTIDFDSNGHIDKKKQEKRLRVSAAMLDVSPEQSPENVIRAGALFAKKKHEREYEWVPTDEEMDLLAKKLFPKRKPKGCKP